MEVKNVFRYQINGGTRITKQRAMKILGIDSEDVFYQAASNNRYKNKRLNCVKVPETFEAKPSDENKYTKISVFYNEDYDVTTVYNRAGKLIYTIKGNKTKSEVKELLNLKIES